MVSGLNSQCHCVNPSALVAVARAALCSISAISMPMRPCSTAPSAHWLASSTPNHSALWASGALSACHKNAATPASSATNCTAANHCTVRVSGGW